MVSKGESEIGERKVDLQVNAKQHGRPVNKYTEYKLNAILFLATQPCRDRRPSGLCYFLLLLFPDANVGHGKHTELAIVKRDAMGAISSPGRIFWII